MSVDYAIIVKNKTRLELLIERFNTAGQAKFYIVQSGGNYEDYEREHEVFHRSLEMVQKQLSPIIKNKIIDRSFLPSFLFNPKQVIIVLGQDGLVANTAKYTNGVPIIGVNPDARRYDGQLLPFLPPNFVPAVEKVLANTYNYANASFAEARLNDGQRLLAFNDLFIGAASHVSARYKIAYNKTAEEHSSSGIIVSTKAGSSGWLSSVFNMLSGINAKNEKPTTKKAVRLSDGQLMFVVREPFLSKKTQAGICAGLLSEKNGLTIESYMPSGGVIFSDGIESDFLGFNSGAIAHIGISEEKAILVQP